MKEKPKSEQMFNKLGFHRRYDVHDMTYVKWVSAMKELVVVIKGQNISYRASRHASFSDNTIDKIREAVAVYREEVAQRKQEIADRKSRKEN